MATVSRSVRLTTPVAEVWAAIGGFQALGVWHPAVATVTKEEIDGVEHRRLGLEGGGEILEKLLDKDGQSYGYAIVEGPLPVKNYQSILSAGDVKGQTVVTWASSFEGTSDDAEDVIAGIYEAGLNALGERFGKVDNI